MNRKADANYLTVNGYTYGVGSKAAFDALQKAAVLVFGHEDDFEPGTYHGPGAYRFMVVLADDPTRLFCLKLTKQPSSRPTDIEVTSANALETLLLYDNLG